MHTSRLIILAGVLAAVVAVFLPFLDAPLVGSVDGLSGAGWPVLVPLGVLAVMAVTGDRAEGFDRPYALLAIVLAAVAVLFTVEKIVDAVLAAREARRLTGSGSVGSGIWVLSAASALALIGAVAGLSRRIR